jgi:diguanylate cyclase (GGDEF)-like protein
MPPDTRLHLGPLTPPAVAELVASELGDAHGRRPPADPRCLRGGGTGRPGAAGAGQRGRVPARRGRGAAAAGIDLDVPFRQTYATALLRAGDATAALDVMNEALTLEDDAVRRGELLDLIATVQLGTGEAHKAVATVQRGMAELGVGLPRRVALLATASLGRFVAGLLVRLSRRWFGTATGERRRRYAVEAALLDTGAQAAAFAMNIPLTGAFLFLALLPVNRLGSSPQRARVLSALGILAYSAGASGIGRRVCAAGEQEAALTRDLGLIAVTAWLRSLGEMLDTRRADAMLSIMEEHGRWLELPDYMMAVSTLVTELVGTGHIAAAQTWVERARQRLRPGVAPPAAPAVECMAAAVEALRGRTAAASTLLRTALDAMPDPEAAERHPIVAWARLIILAEQDELGVAFDEVVTQIVVTPMVSANVGMSATRYTVAFGRIAQARATASRPGVPADERDRRRAQARDAIRALRLTRRIPWLRAGRLASRAGMLHMEGRHDAALRIARRALRRVDLASRDTPLSGGTDADAMALPPELSDLLDTPRSWLAAPIALRERRSGAIVVGSAEPDSYADVEVNIAAVLGDQGAVAYENAELFSRVHQAATVDVLTGASTRHHFWEIAEQQVAAAVRYNRPLAALMLDIDHFKPVNDTYGHAVGDAVLGEIAARIRATIRTSDVLGRYGGEEFAVTLPETRDVVALAERLRAVVSRAPVIADGHEITVTISIGVAHLRPDDDLDSLLGRADAALYESKNTGRDRVSIA